MSAGPPVATGGTPGARAAAVVARIASADRPVVWI